MLGYAVMNEKGEFEFKNNQLVFYKQLDHCYWTNDNIKGDVHLFLIKVDNFASKDGLGLMYYCDKYSIEKELSYDDILNYFRDNKNIVDWSNISAWQKLSEDFIREFKNKVNWNSISAWQKLSEDFIREFKDKVNWGWIFENQTLSDNFKNEFKSYLK